MGDRTTYTVQIRGVEPDYLPAIGRYLEEQWSFEGDDASSWYANDMNVGASEEIASELHRLMVDLDVPFAFRVDEDPVYEWDGTWEGWIPGIGDAAGSADGSGNAHVDSAAVDTVVDAWRVALPDLLSANVQRSVGFEELVDPAEVLVEALAKLTQKGWRDAWDALDAPLPEPDPVVSEATIAEARWLADNPL